MSWAEVSLSIARNRVPTVEAALQRMGALAVTLLDDADQPVLEPSVGSTPLWPVVEMRGLFPETVGRAEVTLALLHVAGLNRPEALDWRTVVDQDWRRAWMDRFQAMRFGERLWIVPSGMQGPEDRQAIVLKMDPGLAFGSGTHPTTALCLRWIDSRDLAEKSVIDYGCGSGVLGIACALQGARHVVCVDNDPQALEATRANAVRNGVSERLECRVPEDFSSDPADLLLANILAGPLIGLAPRLLRSLKPGGDIVLSGVLEEQADAVARVYRDTCGEMEVRALEGWARLHGRRV